MNRSRKDILLEILQMLEKKSCRKTKIVYGTMINFQKAQECLDYLIQRGYIKCNSDRYYYITHEGIIAVDKLENAKEVFQ